MRETDWFHITPAFLLPLIVRSGGLRCGADLATEGSPRRESSRQNDDEACIELDGMRPSDFILLFRRKAAPLLDEKLRGHRRPKSEGRAWNAYPHIRLDFSAAKCLQLAGGWVYGSLDNVGRKLKSNERPRIRRYGSVAEVARGDVREIIVPVASLEKHGRCLPLAIALQRIVAFSTSDRDLVKEYLIHANHTFIVTLDEKPEYAASQKIGSGYANLALILEFYHAVTSDNLRRQEELLKRLATECFD